MSKSTKPVALIFTEGDGAIVTKTHDVELARETLLTFLRDELGYGDDEALEEMQRYLDTEPELDSGRWTCAGSYTIDEGVRFWTSTPLGGRGVTRAVVWSF